MGFGLRKKYDRMKFEAFIRLSNTFARPSKNIRSIYLRPSDMCEPDRLMLYALIRGLRPERVVEIGARWGGGARIISSALQASGFGSAIGIDPEPRAFRPTSKELFNRYRLLVGHSPDAIPEAVSELGGSIDFAFIDAMHTHDHVLADFSGVIPHMNEGGHILLHDTFHVGVNQAIEEILSANPTFIDCGFLTRYPKIEETPVAYEGLRLIRIGTKPSHDTMTAAFELAGKNATLSAEFINWDHHWNKMKDASHQAQTGN